MTASERLWKTYLILSLVTSVSLYGVNLPIYLVTVQENGIASSSIPQLVFAVVVLFIGGVAFHAVPHTGARGGILALEYLLVLFLSVTAGPRVWAQGLLLIPLVVQLGGVTGPALYLPLALASAGVFFYGDLLGPESGVVAWGTTVTFPDRRDSLVLIGFVAVMIAFVTLVRVVMDRFRRQEQLVENLKKNIVNLTQANYAFQKYASAADESARREERLRITREIHDSIGYTMTTLRMMLEAGKDLIANSPLRLEMHLQKALEIVESGSDDVRSALRQLRGSEPEPRGGPHGLKQLIELFADTTGIAIHVNWGDIPWSLPGKIEGALYRFIQEGMSNALSHGNATEIRISFRRDGMTLIAGVADNGTGAVTIIEGIGLQGMRERIEALGGSVHAGSSTVGFLVEAALPLSGAAPFREEVPV